MRIYFGHSRGGDFLNQYYIPIENSDVLGSETLIFPHKNNEDNNNSREFYSTLDLFIAETSNKATGLGIELGFAYDDGVPIYCIYKKGSRPSRSLAAITDNFIEYENLGDMVKKIEEVVTMEKNRDCKKLIK